MAQWDELAAAAMLGTPPASAPGHGPLGELVARLLAGGGERALLGAAAATALYRRAGWQPPRPEQPLPTIAPVDAAPSCGPAVAQRLSRLLDEEPNDVLGEWLAALAGTGRRVPARLLPGLLERARAQPSLQAAVLPVLGERGRWLAAQYPDWEFAVASQPDEQRWQTGRPAERQRLLRELRASDPSRARDWLAASWSSETGEDRALWLSLLAIGLSGDDEPFLEMALDDRRQAVRQQAAELLLRLPASALVERYRQRLAGCLHYRPGPVGWRQRLTGQTAVLEVRPPTAGDAAMQRDGLTSRPPVGYAGGERAWWLQQLIAGVPPADWCQRWSTTADELLALARGSEWQASLIEGWLTATLRQRDGAWAEALILAEAEPRLALLPILPATRYEPIVLKLLEGSGRAAGGEPVALALLIYGQPVWSRTISRAVLAWLRRRLTATASAEDWPLHQRLPEFGRRLAPVLADEAADGWPVSDGRWEYWRARVLQMIGRLADRRAMLKEIADDHPPA